MRSFLLLSSSASRALALTASIATLTLAGCGSGVMAPVTSGDALSFTGTVHGGPNPVVGATVTLYKTGTSGYGAGALPLGTAITGPDGGFTFTSAQTCATPQQVYAVATGGNPGSGTNSNYMLMAALGDCASFNSSSVIWIDEVTTIAAAYSLSNFTTISGTTVNVGAPSTNAASAGSCTISGTTELCQAAGLVHAFNNALNLASSVSTTTLGNPTGQAYTVTPMNDQGTVPALLINSLANAIEVCVNSTGGVASNTTTPCGKLFSYTTPPNYGTTPVAPTNTLQAAINMAKYPENNAASIIGLPSGYTTFYSGLTSAPHDLSIGIAFRGVTIASTDYQFTYPYYLSLDINDNVYALTQKSSSAGPVIAQAMNSNGNSLFQTSALNATSCPAGVPCISAPDALGHLWTVTGSTTAGTINVIQSPAGSISATSYAVSGVPFFGLAVDKYNNVFTSVPSTSATANYYEIAGTSGTPTAVQIGGTNVTTSFVPAALYFDNTGDLYTADKYTASTNGVIGELVSNSTTTTSFGSQSSTTVDNSTTNGLYGIVADNASTPNIYSNNVTTLYDTAGTTTSSFTITDGTVAATSARYSAIDGNASVYLPDNSKDFVYQFFPKVGTYAGGFTAFSPCTIVPATTVCVAPGSSSGSIYGPRNLAVDASGSIWIASSTNGSVTQIIGTANPAWPLLSYEHSGVKP